MIRNPAALDDDGVLICPNCSGSHLRHVVVTVHTRSAEDGPGTTTQVRSGPITGDRPGTTPPGPITETRIADPSEFLGRRNDVVLLMACEGCDELTQLVIQQHKGRTFLTQAILRDREAALDPGAGSKDGSPHPPPEPTGGRSPCATPGAAPRSTNPADPLRVTIVKSGVRHVTVTLGPTPTFTPCSDSSPCSLCRHLTHLFTVGLPGADLERVAARPGDPDFADRFIDLIPKYGYAIVLEPPDIVEAWNETETWTVRLRPRPALVSAAGPANSIFVPYLHEILSEGLLWRWGTRPPTRIPPEDPAFPAAFVDLLKESGFSVRPSKEPRPFRLPVVPQWAGQDDFGGSDFDDFPPHG